MCMACWWRAGGVLVACWWRVRWRAAPMFPPTFPPLCCRWRTALIIREMEAEIDSMARGRPHRDRLKELMTKKEMVGEGRGARVVTEAGR